MSRTADAVALVTSLVAPGARVLDAGCGDGELTVALTDAGFVTLGLDKDLDAIRPVSVDRPKIPFFLDDLTDLDLPMGVVGRGFDAIVLKDVVAGMSLGEIDAALAGCARVAAPDAVLVATVPTGSVGTFVRAGTKSRWSQTSRDVWDDEQVVVVLGLEPERKPSRLRSLLGR